MSLSFNVNNKKAEYRLLGYRICRPTSGNPYAMIVLGRQMTAKSDSQDIAVGMSAESYFFPVEYAEQLNPDMIGGVCHAIISTTTNKGKIYRNIIEIDFE